MATGLRALRRHFLDSDAAIAASEYVLMLGLTLLLLFVVVRVFGRQLSTQWTSVAAQVFGGQPPSSGGGGTGNGNGGNGDGSSGNGNFGCNSNAGKC